MRRVSALFFTMVAVVVVTAFANGCSPVHMPGPFDDDKADFALSSSQCFIGCDTKDTSVLVGSSITVQATIHTHTEETLSLRVVDETMGIASPSTQLCTCESSAPGEVDVHTIACTDACPNGSFKAVTVSFDVQTTIVGDMPVQLLDGSGNAFDSTTVTVHPAKRMNVTVSTRAKGDTAQLLRPGSDGAYIVPVGVQVAVSFQVYDEQGDTLAFTKHGVIPTYANQAAMAPTKDLAEPIIGFTDEEVADALATGDDQITLTAHGSVETIRFHVR